MSKSFEEMSKSELIAELVRSLSRRTEHAHGDVVVLQELATYKEETRVQTDQLIEAQRQLEESRDRYADLYESAPLAYLTLDHEGIIRDVNLTGASLLGEDRQGTLDRPFVRFLAPADRRKWLDHVHGWSYEPGRQSTCELTLDRPDSPNEPILVEVISRPVERDDGMVYRVALVDLTEQKRAEQEIRRLNASLEERVRQRTTELEAANKQLRDADRRKNDFLAMLGHELRNPLAGIANGVALLKLGQLENEDHQEAVRIMDRQLANMTAMLNDLLEASRVTLGKIQLHKQIQDLNDVVASVIEDCCDTIAASHRLKVRLCDRQCRIECDRARIEQIIVNLVQNAAKYTDPGGSILVEVNHADGEARLDVIDTGCGMTEELCQRAFDLFSQADTTIDRAAGGLGIGLTMVKNLAEMHGGRVECSSDGPGKGSRFTVWLPVYVGTEPIGGMPAAVQDDARALSVVVVEDDADSAHLLKLLLERWGHRVELSHTGPSGFESIHRLQPDVAVIDIGLPELDGFELAQRLRQTFPCDQMLLIALTGYGSHEDRQRARDAGFNQHLTKPVSPNQLRDALRAAPRRST
jgi:PAS domain S-box-containing protein